ncbi:recombinase family protein [Vibrio sp. CUB2]|uniref:recombinase family protein n=1 Tax=Vibrio sp. CUB2 TaxID=2315233 RepID=UPI00076A0918|nr:recombinase family protein [Vibrio sp. CUB2]
MQDLPKQAYSYRRFSFLTQKFGSSLKRQTKLAQDYATQHGLTLSDTSFEDLGVSAYRAANASEDAGLGQFLLALREGKITTPCTLLVENLDRLSRAKIKVAMRQLWDITDQDVHVVTLVDGRIYTKDMDFEDIMLAGLIMQRAHEESETKSKRLQEKWQERRTLGKFIHKNCPFWLTPNKDRTDYEVNKYIETVHQIYAMALGGLGSRVIAQELNSSGITAPRGGLWSTATITKVLNNRAVLGEYQPKQRVIVDGVRSEKPIGSPIQNYPVILDSDYFDQVQSALRGRHKGNNRNSTKTYRNVLKHIAHCGCCNGTIRLKQQQHLYYLQCSVECKGSRPVSIRYLHDWLNEVWITSDFASVSLSDVPEAKELATLESELEKLTEAVSGLAAAYAATLDPTINSQLLETSAKKVETQTKLDDLRSELSPYNQTKAAQFERQMLVDLAFSERNEVENFVARTKLTGLLAQLKDFIIHKGQNDIVTFEIKTAQNESKTYTAVKNPYHKTRKLTGKIWNY